MSGLHLVKQGRDRRRADLQRDFTVASPAEFVTRFGGNKVIEKVNRITLEVWNTVTWLTGTSVVLFVLLFFFSRCSLVFEVEVTLVLWIYVNCNPEQN